MGKLFCRRPRSLAMSFSVNSLLCLSYLAILPLLPFFLAPLLLRSQGAPRNFPIWVGALVGWWVGGLVGWRFILLAS